MKFLLVKNGVYPFYLNEPNFKNYNANNYYREGEVWQQKQNPI